MSTQSRTSARGVRTGKQLRSSTHKRGQQFLSHRVAFMHEKNMCQMVLGLIYEGRQLGLSEEINVNKLQVIVYDLKAEDKICPFRQHNNMHNKRESVQ